MISPLPGTDCPRTSSSQVWFTLAMVWCGRSAVRCGRPPREWPRPVRGTRETPDFLTHFLLKLPSTLVPTGTSRRPEAGEELKKMGDRLLRRQEVERITGLSRSSVYRLMQDGDFPRPVRVGPAAVRWSESDIATWMESRPIAESELGPPGEA